MSCERGIPLLENDTPAHFVQAAARGFLLHLDCKLIIILQATSDSEGDRHINMQI